MRVALALLLAGCAPQIPLQGPVEYTPGGYPVSLPVFRDPQMTPDLVKGWVDLRVAEWISAKSTWGLLNYTDAELRRYAAEVPIIIYDDSYVRGDGTRDSEGYNVFGGYIETALYTRPFAPWMISSGVVQILPPNSAGAFSRGCWIVGGIGISSLPHELTHTVLGDFHP